MWTRPIITQDLDRPEQNPLFVAGDLAPRIAGRDNLMREVSATRGAGYREDDPANAATLQDKFAPEQMTPITLGQSEADYGGLVIGLEAIR